MDKAQLKKYGKFMIYDLFSHPLHAMSKSERGPYLGQMLRRGIQHAYQSVPAIKERFDQANIDPLQIREIEDLQRVPILKKEDIIRLQQTVPPFGGTVATSAKPSSRIYISPGPIYDPGLGDEDYYRFARLYYTMGFRSGDIAINSYSYHLVPGGLAVDEGLQRVGVRVVPCGTGNKEIQLRAMRDLKVKGYMGQPSFLMALITKAEELGYDFKKDFELRLAYLTGELLPQALRKRIEDHDINVWQAYATADVGAIACECVEKSGMHVLHDIIVEIVDPATGMQLGPGEVGEIVVTYFNDLYPQIRLATGDLSRYSKEPCACGKASPRITNIVGRVGEAVRVRGLFVHPRDLDRAISKFSEVFRYQLVVDRANDRDQLILRAEVERATDDGSGLAQSLRQAFQDLCQVNLDKVSFVAKGSITEAEKPIADVRVWA